MIRPELRHISELALIRAIPDLTIGDLKPSRKKGLFLRLQREVEKDLALLPIPSQYDLDSIWDNIELFGKKTGWLNETRHVGTLFSFCLEIIENSEFKFRPSITETINDIVSHLEDGKNFFMPSCWAGSSAYEKWESLFENVE